MTGSKTLRRLAAAVVAVVPLVAATATGATAQQKLRRGVTNAALAHGAWADGSSWSKVIPLLEAKGLRVRPRLGIRLSVGNHGTKRRPAHGPFRKRGYVYDGADRLRTLLRGEWKAYVQ